MDRLEFMESIDHGNFVISPENVIQFFDHTMAAYNLIGQYEDIDISSLIDDSSSLVISFKLIFSHPSQCAEMITRINTMNNSIRMYGKLFQIVYINCNPGVIQLQLLQIS